MSHIVKSKVEMKNISCLERAIEGLKLENLGRKVHKLYAGQTAEGIGISLPAWNHPVVINPETGIAAYDNFGGSWGKQIELDKLVQRYTLEVTRDEAIAGGYNYEETTCENGDIQLVATQLVSA